MERVGCIHLIVDTECGTVKDKEGCRTDENVLSGLIDTIKTGDVLKGID